MTSGQCAWRECRKLEEKCEWREHSRKESVSYDGTSSRDDARNAVRASHENGRTVERTATWNQIYAAFLNVIPQGPLVRNARRTTHKSIHRPPSRPKLGYTTPLTLNMLAQRTKRRKPCLTRLPTTNINLLLMTRARQMLVQRSKRPVRPITEITLVRVSVPRCIRSVVLDLAIRVTTRQEAGRISDEVVPVVVAYEFV